MSTAKQLPPLPPTLYSCWRQPEGHYTIKGQRTYVPDKYFIVVRVTLQGGRIISYDLVNLDDETDLITHSAADFETFQTKAVIVPWKPSGFKQQPIN